MEYVTDIGEVLLKLCSIAQTNNINIEIRKDHRFAEDDHKKVFELRINRGEFYAAETVGINPYWSRPAEVLEHAFNRAMYNLKREIEQKKQFEEGA